METFLARVPGLLAAIVVHEYAHAKVADVLGDPTPRAMGRLTLNPLRHLDPIGLIMLWVFGFGWARPVQVNPYNFPDPRRGMMLVAVAGPLTNIVLAYISLVFMHLGIGAGGFPGLVLRWSYLFNLWLAVFNLIPIPPLDGSKILAGLLPAGRSGWLYQLEQYGWILLVMLLMTGVIGRIMMPVVSILDAALRGLVGVLAG